MKEIMNKEKLEHFFNEVKKIVMESGRTSIIDKAPLDNLIWEVENS